MAERDQMLEHELDGAFVVHADVAVAAGQPPVDEDMRNRPLRELGEERVIGPSGGDKQAVDPSFEHEAGEDLAGLLLLEVLGEDDGEAAFRRSLESAAHQLRVDRIAERRNEQAESARRCTTKASGGRVRTVAEVAGSGENALAQLRADREAGILVQDARGDGFRRPGCRCDIGEPGAYTWPARALGTHSA